MNIQTLNSAPPHEAKKWFSQCCTASRWVDAMVSSRPFDNQDQLLETASMQWRTLQNQDFIEAFEGHPMIGNPDSLKEKYRNTHAMASGEQSGMKQATDDVILELARLNLEYFEKFGFIFIVCATGKSAGEMLELIQSRINNDDDSEIAIAAREQEKITAIRINKLIDG